MTNSDSNPGDTGGNLLRRHAGALQYFWVMALAVVAPAFGAPITVNLNSAGSFALLGSTIIDTGDSNITGNVGVTTGITINSPWTVTGTVYTAGPTAAAAYNDFLTAYTSTLGLGNTEPLLGSLPVTQTFVGDNVYTFTNNVSTTTGTVLTFDAQNVSNEVFVIQIDGAFTANGNLTFDLINGAQANNIFWIVQDAATISVGSNPGQIFDGSILAGSSFTMSAAAGGSSILAGTINGCVFAETANTLAGETNVTGCAGGGVPGGAPESGGGGPGGGGVPEPGTAALMGLGGVAGIAAWRRLRAGV